MTWQNNERLAPTGRAAVGVSFDEGLRQHMLRVYNYMTGGLVVTGLVALFVASSPALMQEIWGTPLRWLVILSPLAFVMFLSVRINAISAAAARTTFLAFSAAMGLSLSTLFWRYTGASLAEVFFITAGTFAGMSLYGYTTKRDLTGFGSFLMMGLWGIILAMIVSIFVASAAMNFVISVLGVLIFTGLTAYDTQAIKEMYAEHYGVEANNKLAVMGALNLYLNFINLFQFLLSLMGDRR